MTVLAIIGALVVFRYIAENMDETINVFAKVSLALVLLAIFGIVDLGFLAGAGL